MALTRQVLVTALFITLFLLSTILLLGRVLNDKRQTVVSGEVSQLYSQLSEIQTFFLLSQTYGNEMACLTFEQKLKDLDSSIWQLGIRLDQYRAASEEFTKSSFYLDQKRVFNENELIYMTLLTDLKERCGYHQTVVAYFYKNSQECPQCDDESAVLTSINDKLNEDVAIFSYDMDLNITSLNLIAKYYNVTAYPCTVVDGVTHCGMQGRDQVMQAICSTSNISACVERVTPYQGPVNSSSNASPNGSSNTVAAGNLTVLNASNASA